jgi:hypothetical protein
MALQPRRQPSSYSPLWEPQILLSKPHTSRWKIGFYQQKSGMAMGSSLYPVISNIFMEHFEQLVLDSVPHKPAMWLRYMGDTFVMWSHGMEKLQEFRSHINSLRSSTQFTIRNQEACFLSLIFLCRKGTALLTKVYRKLKHTGRYLHLILTTLLTLRPEWCTVLSIE